MAIAKYSHAFLVGSFNGALRPQDLAYNGWKKKILTHDEYATRVSMYYQSHVDAMTEADGQQKPDFLGDVHHYLVSYQEIVVDKGGREQITKMGESVSINIEKDGTLVDYQFTLCSLHLYCFPLGITIAAIEIDDKGVDIDDLSLAHRCLINWEENICKMADERFKYFLSPLTNLLPNKNISALVKDGNNLKIFQIVQSEYENISERLLFEIATFSPVGSVCGKKSYSLSEDYFNKLIRENSVSTYSNWKALALVDSFTVLSGNGFGSWQWVNLYFPLIYLRCILEKTFCFSRNNEYRLGLSKTTKELSEEIKSMEKYYFYNNFSYNFQPNLVYDSMVRGLDIERERKELSRQIKEKTKEEEENNRNWVTLGLSSFAVFSIAWDFYSLFNETFRVAKSVALIFFSTALLVILGLLVYFFFKSETWRAVKKTMARFAMLKEMPMKYTGWFAHVDNSKLGIMILPHVRLHIATHFLKDLPGSKFYYDSPEKLLEEAERLFPSKFSEAKPDDDGRIRISLTFPKAIGTNNVACIDDLTDEEKAKITMVDRQGKKARYVKTDRAMSTRECQIILSKDWELITMFPGELAPALPESPDIHDEYWDKHVFVETGNK